MRKHPLIGEYLCRPLISLHDTLPIIRHHHEKWNGCGYPDGLEKDDIPLLSRVFQCIDIYDALASSRPYKKAMSKETILDIFHSMLKEDEIDPEIGQVTISLIISDQLIVSEQDIFESVEDFPLEHGVAMSVESLMESTRFA